MSVLTLAGVASAVLNVMTRSAPPVPSEVTVPIAWPPTETVLPTFVPSDSVTVPAVLSPSTSSAATSLPVIAAVKLPPLRFA